MADQPAFKIDEVCELVTRLIPRVRPGPANPTPEEPDLAAAIEGDPLPGGGRHNDQAAAAEAGALDGLTTLNTRIKYGARLR